MKTKLPIFLALFTFLFWNCSSDDDNIAAPVVEDPVINYFPLVVGNTWQYSNTQTTEGEALVSVEDLTVESEQQANNQNLFSLSSNADSMGISFTSILSNGEVYKTQNSMLITGNFDFDLGEADLPDFDVDFQDLVVYDSEAASGTVLFSQDQNIDLPEFNNITLNIVISIQSKSLGSVDEISVDGTTYLDVIGSEFSISLGVDATTIVPPLPIPITLAVINFQEIVNSTNYFANEVGMVQSNTNLSVSFSELITQLPGFDLEDIQVLVEQKLADYQVTLED